MDPPERVIEAIAAGASRRETPEQFGLRASVVIIWVQRYHATEILHPGQAADLCHRWKSTRTLSWV
jgi:transposase